jgi:PHD/YefM family antitoxin component YafN of YafNO toxin-antitoxin module
MTIISSTEARQNFGAFLDLGSREIVVVKRQDREVGAFIPMSDLKKLRELKNKELRKAAKALSEEAAANGLTEDKLGEILSEVNPS